VFQRDCSVLAAALRVPEFSQQVYVLGRTDHDQQDGHGRSDHIDRDAYPAHQPKGPQDTDAGGEQWRQDIEQLAQQQEKRDQQCADGHRHQRVLLGHDAFGDLGAHLGEADRIGPAVDLLKGLGGAVQCAGYCMVIDGYF